jgi:CBS domain-containing protein
MIEGVELHLHGDPSASLIGLAVDLHEHFFYADQSLAEARRLMEDLDLDRLPLVDRSLRVVEVLDRDRADLLT